MRSKHAIEDEPRIAGIYRFRTTIGSVSEQVSNDNRFLIFVYFLWFARPSHSISQWFKFLGYLRAYGKEHLRLSADHLSFFVWLCFLSLTDTGTTRGERNEEEVVHLCTSVLILYRV